MMLRSFVGVLLGGVLCTLVTCAGEVVLPSRFSESSTEKAERPVSVQEPQRVAPASHGVSSAALEPVPPVIVWIMTFVGGIVGGYCAAFIAGRAEVLHGVLAAWPVIVLPLSFVLAAGSLQYMTMGSTFTIVLAVVASGIGGGVRYWQRYEGA